MMFMRDGRWISREELSSKSKEIESSNHVEELDENIKEEEYLNESEEETSIPKKDMNKKVK